MSTSAVACATPYYILRDENRPSGPQVAELHSGIECAPIYGLSDKMHYDKFCSKSQRPLTPYPLVERFLRNQVGAAGNRLTLVVVDAAGPGEPCLHAATMEAVLDAQEHRLTHLSAAYSLILDPKTSIYRVEEASA